MQRHPPALYRQVGGPAIMRVGVDKWPQKAAESKDTMKAQVLYDLRQLTGHCSGTDLHEFFRQHVGDPSPSGKAEINDAVVPDEAKHLIRNVAAAISAMREYGVSEDAISQYEIAWHGGADAETRLHIAIERDEQN